ncbi:NADH ubiquinone oxidoreductase 20 kDa subunit [Hyphomicrobium denitrificans 1NES1]|uniref:hydrogenase (acceptor) n=1 Tax=Hyphomicrobium denitrificans 1NES1 TaxID=670307 RepID=N0B1J0_9HYPH|nr:NADH ubiquinone oxidoreductase 20 kDa subunit [Hyphomicrobium denitrificans]AGK57354.1 NADH ubiquinone oxidoreductase 20 kDa subunit [Hyphomicrobium denitrificans 1NES1]
MKASGKINRKANGTAPGGSHKRTLVWLQSGGCGGCTLSLICAEQPDFLTVLDLAGIQLLWHPALSEASGSEVRAILDSVRSGETPLDILCIEGSVVHGPNGSGRFHLQSGSGEPMKDVIAELCRLAGTVIAVGTCAAFGGVTAAGENHVEATGIAYSGSVAGGLFDPSFRGRSGLRVINISGCPVHPDWVIETLLQLSLGVFTEADLDSLGRPKFYAEHLVHHGCPRNEYYEYKASAEHLSNLGCLMENLGCMATQVHADCNIRLWNGDGSCTRGGYPCISCTEPGFENQTHPYLETPKLAGIPIGLPTDMPKAWFVALAALSKAATPHRVKANAIADYIITAPSAAKGKAPK